MSDEPRKILSKVADFFRHKREVEAGIEGQPHHHGVPEQFPCVVVTEVRFDRLGAVFYHTFQYRVETTCDHCGTKALKWPSEIPVAKES